MKISCVFSSRLSFFFVCVFLKKILSFVNNLVFHKQFESSRQERLRSILLCVSALDGGKTNARQNLKEILLSFERRRKKNSKNLKEEIVAKKKKKHQRNLSW